MRFFKTRHEVKQLRQEIAELRAMLVAHFGIMYTMDDYKKYYERHPEAGNIAVAEGEWYHYSDMLGPVSGRPDSVTDPKVTALSFRNKRVIIKE